MLIEKLEQRLKELKKVAICYSGGIDSSFLLYVANKTLSKENVLAIIANGEMIPRKDYKEAIDYLKQNKFQYIEMQFKPLDILEFRENREDRCYHCKRHLMGKIKEIANKRGFSNILDGSNIDDTKTYRPGMKAKQELNIISPLEGLSFTKQDIRQNAKKLDIEFWNKPSNSCLATRFEYNRTLSKELLKKVEQGEEYIKSIGIPKTRLRIKGNTAKIEVDEEYTPLIKNNQAIANKIKDLGFNL